MFLNKKGPLLASLVTALAVMPAHADQNWRGSMEAGMLLASGNAPERTITARADATRNWADWRQNLNLESRYTERDDQRTAERYRASTQLDYKFNPHDFVFVRGSYDDDSFSGFQFQASATAGYGRRVWQLSDGTYFDASIGAGYRFSRFDMADPDGRTREEDPIGRLAANFRYELSPTATFRQDLETEVSLDDAESISKSVTSLQANLVGSLAMRLSYTLERVSDVPVNRRNTDTITAVTLLYSF
ncbi:MAG: DUF481 domain-containing protein [Halomonadaceae bacterium]|nr:MAG: DUF481 domain-containing protein [Halomonadaceae bacterium]